MRLHEDQMELGRVRNAACVTWVTIASLAAPAIGCGSNVGGGAPDSGRSDAASGSDDASGSDSGSGGLDGSPVAFGQACSATMPCTDPVFSVCRVIKPEFQGCTKTCNQDLDCPSPPTTGSCTPPDLPADAGNCI